MISCSCQVGSCGPWSHPGRGSQYLVPGECQRPSLRDSLHHNGKYETFLLHFWLRCRNCSSTTASLEGLATSLQAWSTQNFPANALEPKVLFNT